MEKKYGKIGMDVNSGMNEAYPPKSPPSSSLLPTPASTTNAARDAELTKPAHAACRARLG